MPAMPSVGAGIGERIPVPALSGSTIGRLPDKSFTKSLGRKPSEIRVKTDSRDVRTSRNGRRSPAPIWIRDRSALCQRTCHMSHLSTFRKSSPVKVMDLLAERNPKFLRLLGWGPTSAPLRE